MTSPGTASRILRVAALGLAAGLLVAGCAAEPAARPASEKSPKPSATPSTTPAVPDVETVPGYAPGEFPPVPLFALPDLSLLTGSAGEFAIEVDQSFEDIPGVTVTAAQCDAGGSRIAGEGLTYLYGDGSGSYVGADGITHNYGDGSGKRVDDGVIIDNYGDGSGKYVGGGVIIDNYGDGSGKFVGGGKIVDVYGDGSGKYVHDGVIIDNYGDGSGKYVGDGVIINNYGDGSGKYVGDGLIIENFGDGTGRVGTTDIEVAPLPPVQKLGVFPPLEALRPIESCGTIITFDSAVLFDFDRSDIRPDAAQTLASVADVLDRLDVSRAVVSGHTDAIGSDAYNQDLSERRARSVVDDLKARGVGTALSAEGYGESRPVAPNEIDGTDNPAGRQLNRRVELFIPATL